MKKEIKKGAAPKVKSEVRERPGTSFETELKPIFKLSKEEVKREGDPGSEQHRARAPKIEADRGEMEPRIKAVDGSAGLPFNDAKIEDQKLIQFLIKSNLKR